jgi:shikimate kinase
MTQFPDRPAEASAAEVLMSYRASTVGRVLIWINGAFGVGKSTTARHLVQVRPDLRLFDPEWVGFLLTAHLEDREIADFQDLPSWRQLVPVVARHLAQTSGQDLVAVQTVLSERYWSELRHGLAAEGIDVIHVLLDADAATLDARITADRDEPTPNGGAWTTSAVFADARPWLMAAADLVVDTTTCSAMSAAAKIAAMSIGRAGVVG